MPTKIHVLRAYFVSSIDTISFTIFIMVNSDSPTLLLKSAQDIDPPIF